jgi:hypothetical protein
VAGAEHVLPAREPAPEEGGRQAAHQVHQRLFLPPGAGRQFTHRYHSCSGTFIRHIILTASRNVISSVGDPDPQEPHVFGPPVSGSISQRYGYGFGSFPFLSKVLSGLK